MIKQKLFKKPLLTFFILLLSIVFNTQILNTTIIAKDIPINTTINAYPFLSKDSINLINSSLLKEIDDYIQKHGPNSKLLSSTLIIICKKYNFDIVLAMSQAHIESQYGTVGIASRTNSVFNVGTFDDGTILYRYSDPNHSIEPYTNLMVRNYLRNKTTDDLLKPWSFVDFKGDRYASFKYYEYRVRQIYIDIKKNTNIDPLYQIYISDHYQKSVQFYIDHSKIVAFSRK